MLSYVLAGMTYAFAATLQPGVFQTYLISRAAAQGWRRTLPAALAPLLSDGPVILLVLLVLSRVPAWFVPALQIAGGVFVLYLTFGAFKAWRVYDASVLAPDASARNSLAKAVLVNLLNPNPYIAWSLVLGPLLLKGWREAPARGIALLAGFYAVMVAGAVAIIVLFASARRLGPGVTRVMVGVSAVLLACFACYLLWSGARAL